MGARRALGARPQLLPVHANGNTGCETQAAGETSIHMESTSVD